MSHWTEFLGGLALVLVVFADVFTTVLVPRASHRGMRFGPLLAAMLAPPWRWLATRLPSARLRQSVRGSLGPFILVLSLALWVAALAFGFAAMLHSQPENVSMKDYGFAEALYQSTLALSTLGMIDAEVSGSARAVVAIAGISGFAIVSLVVAFLLSIQNALHRREVLVLTLAARAGRPPSGLRLLETMAHAEDDTLESFFASWEVWTADVLQSHLSYTVLCRFRSLDEDMEWLACLGAVLDAAALVVAAELPHYPRARLAAEFLVRSAERASHELGRLLGIDAGAAPVDRNAFEAAHEAVGRLGYAPVAEVAEARARFDKLRSNYAMTLANLADQLDIKWGDTAFGRSADALATRRNPRRRSAHRR